MGGWDVPPQTLKVSAGAWDVPPKTLKVRASVPVIYVLNLELLPVHPES